MSNFILSCESTVDLPFSYINGRGLPVIFYTYNIGETQFEDDMGRNDAALPDFYKKLSEGALSTTSQINEYRYLEFFEPLVKESDLLHIVFGSGMTSSINGALSAAEQLREKYPDRKIVIIDSTCSCAGYGLLVDYAADLKDEGKSLEETAELVENIKHNVHHQFFSTDLKYFKRSGRVSGATATIGTVLGICPIMHLNYDGRIIAYSKARGKKNAVRKTVEEMLAHARDGKNYNGKFFICHSNCEDLALQTVAELEENFPNLKGKTKLHDIGTIIASHCGPGTVAIFFIGDERAK